jgi:hypothetical protein
MNANHLNDKFASIGARLKLHFAAPGRWQADDYAVDIRRDEHGEFFELRLPEHVRRSHRFTVMQADKRDRHLLLMVRKPDDKLDRFLCGHDERHWFVAAVPGGASSVAQAKAALKPRVIQSREDALAVPRRLRNRRKNEAFRRQGEWFFLPVKAAERDPVNEKFTLRNEPLRRGAGKPHLVEELYRVGGEVVYVCPKRPNGITEAQFRRLIQREPDAARWPWQVLRRNPRVYARGRVRHPDHATITLPDWHRVVLNTETETETMRNVAFID